MLISAAIKQQK